MNKHKHPNQIVAVITEGEKMLFLEHPNPIISIIIEYTIKQYIINLVLQYKDRHKITFNQLFFYFSCIMLYLIGE
mgnify:FL=1